MEENSLYLSRAKSWVPKNWCFWTMVLEKTLESPLDCKEIQPVHPKGDKSWVFIGRTDAEAETLVLWPTHAKSWLIGKDPDAGKDWGQEEKGVTERWDGWMASPAQWTWVWINSRSLWWTGRPGMLRFIGRKESDMTEQLNWTELNWNALADNMQGIKMKYISVLPLFSWSNTSLLDELVWPQLGLTFCN